MTDDFLYKNAPLIEVIAEVHWELTPIQSVPGGAIDPFGEILRNSFSHWAKEHGHGEVQELVPDHIPKELLANRPLQRFRPAANKWPLYQLGPGILTANIVPPYQGWQAFQKHLDAGIEALFASHPAPADYMKIKTLELRYVDAFTKEHGYDRYDEFLQHHLSISHPLPASFLEKHSSPWPPAEMQFEAKFPCANSKDLLGIIRCSPGISHNKPAAVLQLIVRNAESLGGTSPDKISQWFHNGHLILREWFNDLPSNELKELMGPREPIGDPRNV